MHADRRRDGGNADGVGRGRRRHRRVPPTGSRPTATWRTRSARMGSPCWRATTRSRSTWRRRSPRSTPRRRTAPRSRSSGGTRKGEEPLTVLGGQRLAPTGVAVENRAFDITPAELVTAYVTEEGVTPRCLRSDRSTWSRITSSRWPEEHVVAGDGARAVDAAGRHRAADGRVLALVLDVEVVELGADRPRRLAEERPSRALRQPDDVRRVRALVDHVVKIVVRVHPRPRWRCAVRPPSRAWLQLPVSSAKRLSAASSSARPSSSKRGTARAVASDSSSARDEEGLSQLVARQRPDPGPPVRDELDEPERRQSPQRLADRRAGDSYCSDSDSWRRIDPGSICPETISSSRAYAISSAFVDSTQPLVAVAEEHERVVQQPCRAACAGDVRQRRRPEDALHALLLAARADDPQLAELAGCAAWALNSTGSVTMWNATASA